MQGEENEKLSISLDKIHLQKEQKDGILKIYTAKELLYIESTLNK